MKKVWVIYIALLVFVDSFGQTTSLNDVKSELDAMFVGLDKTKVPTGFLWDTAVNLVEGDFYNGSALTDSNFVSLPIMGDMLRSINSASVGADTICVQAALSRLQRNSSQQSSMIGILFKPYNYIVANALTDNLINYSNGVVSDSYVNGIWQNPYGESVLFGFADGSDGVVDLYTSFTIANIDSLSTQTFQSIQFDPGDGNGFRSVSLGSTVIVSYLNEGVVETKLAVTVGGQTYYSHGVLQVKYPIIEPNATSSALNVDTTLISTRYIGDGKYYHAQLVYDCSVAFNKKPLIVSEGFDPWQLSNQTNPLHSFSGFSGLIGILSAYDPSLGKSLFDGYDVFYVDWYDCGADIRANAEVLKEVIRWVNSHNLSGESNTVLGQSMGGLIARYALRDMELNNEAHNTTLFISHDVPYLGANISMGLQYLYWDLLDLIGSDNLGVLADIGNYQSVKQLLPLYIDSSPSPNSYAFDSLQSELLNMGFPQGDSGRPLENVSIVNGGKTRKGNSSIYNEGEAIFHILANGYSNLMELIAAFKDFKKNGTILIPGKGSFSYVFEVLPYLSNNSTVYRAELSIKKKLLWFIEREYSLHSIDRKSPSSGYPLDAVCSSFFTPYEKPIISIHKDTIMFIPSGSALCYNNYSRDFLSNKPRPIVEVPFDSYIISDTSTFHTSFYNGIGNWLGHISNMEVCGPDIALPGDQYLLSGASSTGSVSWDGPTSSYIGSTTGIINSNNVHGLRTIKGVSEDSNSVISKKKTVLSGLPRITLDVSNANQGFYVHARYLDEGVESFIEEHNLRDSLSYSWYLVKNAYLQSLSSTADSVLVTGLDSTVYSATIALTISYKGHHATVTEGLIVPAPYYTSVQSIDKFRNTIIYLYDAVNFPASFFPTSTDLILRSNPYYGLAPEPYKIEVLNQEIDDPVTVVDNGVTYYFFDVFSNQVVQQFFSSLTRENSPQPLEMVLYDEYDNEIQTIQYNVTCSR